MKVYSLSKVWMFVVLLLCAVFFLIGAGLLFFISVPGIVQHPDAFKDWFLLFIGLIILVFTGYTTIESIKGKFVIENDKVYQVSALFIRELYLSEVKGYRVDDKYIYVEPISTDKKGLKISKYFGDTDDLLSWLSHNYKDLDLIEREEQYKNLLDEAEYGDTAEERLQKLQTAKKVAIAVNIIGGLIAMCLLVLPGSGKFLIVLSIIAPLVFVLILRSFNGLIVLIKKKNSPHPTLIIGLFAVMIFLFVTCFKDYRILEHQGIWQPAILVALLFLALLILGNKAFKLRSASDIFIMAMVMGVAFAYGYGSVVSVNCAYDTSISHPYQAEVLDKHITHGKSTNYYLTIAPWGNQKKPDKISVSRVMYNWVNLGDHVAISQYDGLLKIPWYTVTAK